MTFTISKAKAVSAALVALAIAGLFLVTGCAKFLEPYNDAPVSGKIGGAAEVGSMPDGFSNFAEKCDTHGNRVFVVYHGDKGYGSVFALKDPTCLTGK
jgi:hypothetical protein